MENIGPHGVHRYLPLFIIITVNLYIARSATSLGTNLSLRNPSVSKDQDQTSASQMNVSCRVAHPVE